MGKSGKGKRGMKRTSDAAAGAGEAPAAAPEAVEAAHPAPLGGTVPAKAKKGKKKRRHVAIGKGLGGAVTLHCVRIRVRKSGIH